MKKLFKNLGKVALAGTIGLTALGMGTESASAVEFRAFTESETKYVKNNSGYYSQSHAKWGLIDLSENRSQHGALASNQSPDIADNQLRCVYNSYTDVVKNNVKASPEVSTVHKLTGGYGATVKSQCTQAVATKTYYRFGIDGGKWFKPTEAGRAVTSVFGVNATVYVNVKPRFSDVKIETSYWDEIEYLAKKGIIKGKTSTTFDPKGTLTKSQVASMISRALNLDKKYPANYKFSHKFSDLSTSHWAYRDIMMATEYGIFNKTAKFSDNAFTRGEMAVVLNRAFDIKGSTVAPKNFSDVTVSSVGSEMYNAVRTLSKYSIAQGGTDGKFNPKQKLSRQHFALFMARTMEEGQGFRYLYVQK